MTDAREISAERIDRLSTAWDQFWNVHRVRPPEVPLGPRVVELLKGMGDLLAHIAFQQAALDAANAELEQLRQFKKLREHFATASEAEAARLREALDRSHAEINAIGGVATSEIEEAINDTVLKALAILEDCGAMDPGERAALTPSPAEKAPKMDSTSIRHLPDSAMASQETLAEHLASGRWMPPDCRDPESCHSHKACMYTGCSHRRPAEKAPEHKIIAGLKEAAEHAKDACLKCGHPRSEHTYNGACYGLCASFQEKAPEPAPSEAAVDVVMLLRQHFVTHSLDKFNGGGADDLAIALDQLLARGRR